MALTSQEQNKVLQLCGYGGKAAQVGSVIYDRVLNDRLHQLPADTESLVRSYLTQITAIESQIFAAPTRLVAKQVQDITTNLQEIEMLRRERRRIAREIADHLDIPYLASGGVNVGMVV